ncbi:MAG TPA: SDR family NAD(P)-dependent oxidoreductase [Rhizomicrobium sp.]|jgi:NAD(P)-dependent dehydrogenase (short-subunit alcohol dehydrogenase family)
MPKALRVLVTGAAGAIGMATARLLAARGHSVVATDLSALRGLEGIQAHVLDVTSDDSVARCLEEVGSLDAIVNSAGISGGGPVEGYPLDRFRQMFETNTLGPLRVIQAVLPAWRKRGSGVIVNVSSVSGRVSSPLEAAYSASKFALEALTESLHLEVRHFGIRSVIIEPGTIAPGMKASEHHQGPADYAGLWEQWAGAHTKMTGPSAPGPEIVAVAIASAIEDAATPLRVPVGQDAEMILGLRRSLDDQAFEDAMRKAVGLTW